MRCLTIVAVFLLSCSLQAADEPPAPSAAQIAALIKQLDAEAFDEREAAVAALKKIGPAAREALAAAVADNESSAEVRLRASAALKEVDLQILRSKPLPLAEIIAEARAAKSGKYDQARLEALLEGAAFIWSDTSGDPQTLPVRFKDVAPVDIAVERSPRGGLVILGAGQLTSVRNSIVLAETAVDISIAQNCIIIAGVSASVSSPRGCIIIAGHDIEARSGQNNLLLSGGAITGSSARKSVAGAPAGVTFPIGDGLVLVNSPEAGGVRIAGAGTVTHAKSAGLDLTVPDVKTELGELITLTLAITQAEPIALFRRKDGDGEYVARGGQELKFPDGKPIPELAGWKLTFCGRRGYAVFQKGEQHELLKLPAAAK